MKGFFKFLLLTIYIIFSLILIDKLKEILEFKELIIVAIVMFIFLFLFILLLRRNFLIIPSYFLLILLVLVIHNIAKTSDNFFSFVNGIVSNENIISILRQDKNIKDVFKAMDKMNMAVVGIGSPIDENSNVIKNGYFNEKDVETI